MRSMPAGLLLLIVCAAGRGAEVLTLRAGGIANAVMVPQSVNLDMKDDWPKEAKVTVGRASYPGFYLNAADPRGLLGPLNLAIDRCRVVTR